MHARLFVASLAVALFAPTTRAQNLELTARGGSIPGPIEIDLANGFPFELAAILPAFDPGPTPLSLIDPNDPRSLQIGIGLLGSAHVGLVGLDGHLRLGPLPVPPLVGFTDFAIFWQGITIQGSPTLVSRISNPDAFRMADANTFRDRSVTFVEDRAFAVVLPRADRTWMIVGGGRGALLAQVARSSCEIYDPISDTFSYGPSMLAARSLHTATRLQDGRWLLCGGVNTNNDPQPTCEIYDPIADAFAPAATMASARMGHTATLLGDGRVLVTGGLRAMTTMPSQLYAIRDATDTAEIYDPVADAWSAAPNLRTPRAGHIAILRPNGSVLLGGGISWDAVPILGWLPAVRSSCDLYDPIANTMTAGPSMATSRSMVDPVEIGNGRWLVAGGIASVSLLSPGTPTAAADVYDANTNTWTPAGPMAAARGNHKGWSLGGGRVMLAGGANGSILSPVPLASVEVYDASTNAFAAGPAMTIPRAGAASYLTPEGQVHVFGGGTANGVIAITTEWYYF